MPGHFFRFLYDPANDGFVFPAELALAGVVHIETQSVGSRKISARRGVVNLGKVFHSKSLSQEGGLEGPSQVDQKKRILLIAEYMGKVKVSMTIRRFVESFNEVCQACDKIPSPSHIFSRGRSVEIVGQLSLNGFGIWNFFGENEASFLKYLTPLLAI